MAQLINGHLHGKLGKMVACKYKDKEGGYFRQAPVRTSPPTQGEMENRHKFALVHTWLRPIRDFVRRGFQNQPGRTKGLPVSFGYNRKHAVKGDGFEAWIDPSLARVSQGDLPLPGNLQVVLDEEHQLQFTWDNRLDSARQASDLAMLLAYNVKLGKAVEKISAATRLQGRAVLDLSPMAPGPYYIYVAFRSADGTSQSNSEYLGAVEV